MLLGVGYSQCNESNWQQYFPDLTNCNLGGADLSGENLEGVQLSSANLYMANLEGANLKDAWLWASNLSSANLEWANLAWANLTSVGLTGTDLTGACLEGVLGFTQTDYEGLPILEGCADTWGECLFQDDDEDGYDDASYTSGYNMGYMNGVITGEISADENNDGLVDDFPLITILGSTALVLTQTHEANYIDDGATCFAGEYNLFQNVVVSGDVVNLSNIGISVISYNCQDNVSGNQAITKYRTVIVQADYSDEDNDGYDDASYIAGLEEGILVGGQSGDSNGDGTLDILDIVYFIDVILYP